MTDDKKPRIVIVGSGSLGRELMNWLRDDGYQHKIVFLDDVTKTTRDLPVIGKIQEAKLLLDPDDRIFVAMANPHDRATIEKVILDAGFKLSAYKHRTAIPSGATFGHGTMLLPYSLMSTNARVGRSLLLNTYGNIGHDVTIGDHCTLCSHVTLTGRVKVGHRVFIGTGAVVVPDVVIGDDAYIGAGSVVLRNVPKKAKVFGNPARLT